MEKWNKNKVGPKPSRYLGNRFINFEEHFHSLDESFDEIPAMIHSDLNVGDIGPLLIKVGVSERDAQIIKLRFEGYDYKEIAEMTGNNVSALTQRYKRAIEKLGRKKDFL